MAVGERAARLIERQVGLGRGSLGVIPDGVPGERHAASAGGFGPDRRIAERLDGGVLR